MIQAHDLTGAAVFVEGETLRDESGKVLARAVDRGEQTRQLSNYAASWMDGRILMDLGPGDVATAATQADFGIPENDCVADTVSRVRLVSRDRGVYFVQSATDAISLPIADVDGTGAPGQISGNYTPVPFATKPYALAAKLPRMLVSNADFDVKARELRRLVEALRLGREKRVADQLTAPATWAAANRIAPGANKWNGGTTPNPLGDLFAALKAAYLPANTLVMSESVAPYFFTSTVQTFVQAGGRLPRIVVAGAQYLLNGAQVYAWGPASTVNVPLLRCPDDPKAYPSALTFRWNVAPMSPGESVVNGISVRTFFDPRTDSDYVVCAHNDTEVVLSNQVGAIISGAIA